MQFHLWPESPIVWSNTTATIVFAWQMKPQPVLQLPDVEQHNDGCYGLTSGLDKSTETTIFQRLTILYWLIQSYRCSKDWQNMNLWFKAQRWRQRRKCLVYMYPSTESEHSVPEFIDPKKAFDIVLSTAYGRNTEQQLQNGWRMSSIFIHWEHTVLLINKRRNLRH